METSFKQINREIKELARQSQMSAYQMAVRLNEVEDGELFLEGGYLSMSEYIEGLSNEVGLSAAYIRRIKKISTNFSEADFIKIGVKKLTIVLEVPEKKEQLLKMARAGASRAQMERALGRHGAHLDGKSSDFNQSSYDAGFKAGYEKAKEELLQKLKAA